MTLPSSLHELARRSAAPDTVAPWLEHLLEARGEKLIRALEEDPALARLLVDVAAASRSLGRLLQTNERALEQLSDLDRRPSPDEADSPVELAAWKHVELLRIAARDLAGVDDVDAVGRNLAAMADDLLTGSCRLAATEGLAVIAMGKLGALELNYSSDIDVLFVGSGGPAADRAARRVLDIARRALRVDTALRPEGRDGPLVRSLDSYLAYWDRWARPWEFQALIKARHAAGEAELGARFEAEATERVWSRRIDADALAELRSMKARVELDLARRGLDEREIKLGRGGIRDIEFAVQLLQLVHGPADPGLRLRGTIPALAELGSAGYIAGADAVSLSHAYRFLRTVEHRLQLVEEGQVHTLPTGARPLEELARTTGFPSDARGGASGRMGEVLARYQGVVRSIHERLYFRPLLESFTKPTAGLGPDAARERLVAFGFRDVDRTREALAELTRGLTRRSRLMSQMLPLLLDWCSSAPDPDLALLGLRTLAGTPHPRQLLLTTFRESPEAARRLCLLAGTSKGLQELLRRHPEEIARLGDDAALCDRDTLERRRRRVARDASDPESAAGPLRHLVGTELTRIAARDVLGLEDVVATGRSLSRLAAAALSAALEVIAPPLPFAVVAMGRLGGAELAYGSDLDVLLVYDGEGAEAARVAEVAATSLIRLMNGATPAERVIVTDVKLRPEGRQGSLVRSLDTYLRYYERWADTWERQALLRARPVAGDDALGKRFMEVVGRELWDAPATEEEVREIRRLKARVEKERLPAGADPQFHLKLGRGSLSDVEWTAQLLQLRHGVSAAGTIEALDLLVEDGCLAERDGAVLRESYRFCEMARNRWHLMRGQFPTGSAVGHAAADDSLPTNPEQLSRLARSLGTNPVGLREEYRRVTRRARRVVERRFYGL